MLQACTRSMCVSLIKALGFILLMDKLCLAVCMFSYHNPKVQACHHARVCPLTVGLAVQGVGLFNIFA